MSTAIEVRLEGSSPDGVVRALGALGPGAWALELFGRAPRESLWALYPEHDPARVLEDVRARLATAGVRVSAIDVRTKLPGAWIGGVAPERLYQVGPLWIVPKGNKRPATATHFLELESKNAFGSGTHPTTTMMLERVLELSPMTEVLDVGAGSGILGLAALALGARAAVGVELEDDAIRVARDNAERNGLAGRYEIGPPPLSRIEQTFPVVLANIVATVLISLAEELVARVAPGGRLVLSGVRPIDVAQVVARFSALGLGRCGEVQSHEWVRLDLTPRG
ncbi:50S ribosomal protein L11 methyltransferase [Myxococcota bacterium]|nr:50S ribosomal protein L11 methyltransferase [Myxococcota bacterium]